MRCPACGEDLSHECRNCREDKDIAFLVELAMDPDMPSWGRTMARDYINNLLYPSLFLSEMSKDSVVKIARWTIPK